MRLLLAATGGLLEIGETQDAFKTFECEVDLLAERTKTQGVLQGIGSTFSRHVISLVPEPDSSFPKPV